jgi:hypothetical protein
MRELAWSCPPAAIAIMCRPLFETNTSGVARALVGIVNLDFLVQIEPTDAGDAQLLLKNGIRIPCSRRYRQSLRGDRLGAVATE